MKLALIPALILAISCVFLSGCQQADGQSTESAGEAPHEGGSHEEGRRIVATNPVVKDVITTQEYVCQIHSRRHIEVRSLEGGYLEEVQFKEGQRVQQGDLMFKIYPVLFEARLETEEAEAQRAQIELNNQRALFEKDYVSDQAVLKAEAKLKEAQARVKQAKAELSFTEVRAPFDGIIDRQNMQQGSLIEEGEILSTLSDNDVMWVYFNVPEARYLEYMSDHGTLGPQHPHQLRLPDAHIELRLADGSVFNQTAGDVVTIEGDFDNETGNIAFRADFPNPDGLLRHGQTGTVMIHRVLHDAVVIPQRATYEILDKQYVYVVDEQPGAGDENAEGHTSEPDEEQHSHQVAAHSNGPAAEHGQAGADRHGIIRQRRIVVQDEMDDVYVIESGLGADDKFVLEGSRQVHDGEETDYGFQKPEEVLSQLKYHAE